MLEFLEGIGSGSVQAFWMPVLVWTGLAGRSCWDLPSGIGSGGVRSSSETGTGSTLSPGTGFAKVSCWPLRGPPAASHDSPDGPAGGRFDAAKDAARARRPIGRAAACGAPGRTPGQCPHDLRLPAARRRRPPHPARHPRFAPDRSCPRTHPRAAGRLFLGPARMPHGRGLRVSSPGLAVAPGDRTLPRDLLRCRGGGRRPRASQGVRGTAGSYPHAGAIPDARRSGEHVGACGHSQGKVGNHEVLRRHPIDVAAAGWSRSRGWNPVRTVRGGRRSLGVSSRESSWRAMESGWRCCTGCRFLSIEVQGRSLESQ